MADELKDKNSAFQQDDDLVGKQIKAVPAPEKGIGIDTNGAFYDNLVQAGTSGQLDFTQIEKFTQLSQGRDTIYTLLDTMSQDPTISAILETYAEDATETNDQGRIVWCESDDSKVGEFITYLLDTIGVDKHVYKWVHSLCKYGDCYLRLFRESEFKDDLFDDVEEEEQNKPNKLHENVNPPEVDKEQLQEDVKVKVYSQNDRYVHYLEMVPNPAEMFELTKFGKSYAYIQAKVNTTAQKNTSLTNSYYTYSFKKKDVDLYDATNFVHASLEDNSSRVPEKVQIFRGDMEDDSDALTYTVKRGQSLLYNSFKIWRELMLLENSLLLNRITKSSIVRVVNVEVGDMPKENVGPHLMGIKQLMEQKSAINTGESLNEYTNHGPMENNIYVPVHNQVGTISVQAIGGDPDVKGLGDIDYFKNKFFGSMRVPKQYFGETDDNAGFSGGESLSLISSRYAKMVKRIQNTLIQALTDAANLMLLDKGLSSYINKFELHMLPPTTKEENDRRDSMDKKVGVVNNIMQLLDDIEDPSARLKILKALLASVVSNPDVMDVIEEQIEVLEEQIANGEVPQGGGEDEEPVGGIGPRSLGGSHMSSPSERPEPEESGEENRPAGGGEEANEPATNRNERVGALPTPAELGIDMTDNNLEI